MKRTEDGAAGLKIKLERAKEHITALDREADAFFKDTPYVVTFQTDLRTKETIVRVHVREQPPARLGALVGDAIHNLRSTLDLLMWRLVRARGITPKSNIRFPIVDHEAKLDAALSKMLGFPQPAVSLIKDLRPYKDGNDSLWALHRLDVIDKHHVLLLVGGACNVIDIDQEESREFAKLLEKYERRLGVCSSDLRGFKLSPFLRTKWRCTAGSIRRQSMNTPRHPFTFSWSLANRTLLKGSSSSDD